ncbi:hypothetical protein M9458_031034, partial [Cirrhinus mrigala]
GQFMARTQLKRGKKTLDCHFRVTVIKSGGDNLLSRAVGAHLGLIQHVEEVSVYGELRLLKGEPVKIELKENARPYSITTPRRIPIPLVPKVEEELRRMKCLGIIESVTEPTEWVAPMVPVVKPSGKIRICVDLKRLNKSAQREKLILPALDDILHRLAGSTVFSSLDAASGFWQIPLDEESARLTTFITPLGRFCFKRLPFGVTSAPEIFQRKMCELLRDHEGTIVYMDDILVSGGDGISPQPDRVTAITAVEPPQNQTELRRLLGMVNFLGRYLPHLSSVLHPLNDLLRADVAWLWGPEQGEAFKKVKALISSAPVLQFFNLKLRTVVSADASSHGLGGVLLQEHEGGLRPVAFCSRILTDAGKRYAQIEKECLASVWASEQFYQYLCGLETYRLVTDHKPLVTMINGMDLDKVPLRCQRLLIRLMKFNPVAEYMPGKNLVVADALSRHPKPGIDETGLGADIQAHINTVEETEKKPVFERIKAETAKDHTLQLVKGYVERGKRMPESAERAEILERIHHGHMGLTKSRERYRDAVWWPHISKAVKEKVQRPSQPREPLITTPLPELPWQKLAADLCELNGKTYLIVTDYYSRWLEILSLPKASSEGVIQKLVSIIARFGILEQIVTDNGPQFRSQVFTDFIKAYEIIHITSSPYYPQANGMAERAVKTAKTILRQENPALALLSYRDTPTEPTRESPAVRILPLRQA